MGLGFALCMGLFDLIFEGSVNLWKSLFHMIFFGTTMTLVFELGHIYAYLRFLHPQYVLPLRQSVFKLQQTRTHEDLKRFIR